MSARRTETPFTAVARLSPVYPVLGSVYAVLAFASGSENLRPTELLRPLLISVGLAAAIWLLATQATRNRHLGAVIALLSVVASSSFSSLEARVHLNQDGGLSLLLVLIYLLVMLTLFLRRRAPKVDGLSRYLDLVSAVLVMIGGASLMRHVNELPAPKFVGSAEASQTGRPDIFVIVLDKYTASHTLGTAYGYDNAPFEEALRERGFIVPRTPRANYVNTSLALAAMLNARYLGDLTTRFGRDNPQWPLVYPMVEDNLLARTFQSRGSRYVFFPTAFPATRASRLANEQIPAPGTIRPELEVAWLATTPLPLVQWVVCGYFKCPVDAFPYASESATLLDWKFRQLGGLPRGDKPLFVFVHLTLPHEPYVYRADCSHRRPFWPLTDQDEVAVKRAYVEQIECLNRKVIELVDELDHRPGPPPVIVLQADHGHGRIGRLTPPLKEVRPEQVADRSSVFAAYQLPGVKPSEVSDSISPINIARLLLRHYGNVDLPMVQDATFWSDWDRPYDFKQVK